MSALRHDPFIIVSPLYGSSNIYLIVHKYLEIVLGGGGCSIYLYVFHGPLCCEHSLDSK